jgi:hypothetical protein
MPVGYHALRDLGDELVQQLTSDEWEIIESELDPAVARQIRSAYEGVVRGAVPEDLDIYELI